MDFIGLKLAGVVLAGLAAWGIWRNWYRLNSVDDLKKAKDDVVDLWSQWNSPEDILAQLDKAKARMLEIVDKKKEEVVTAEANAAHYNTELEYAKARLADTEAAVVKLG